jgi:uncharacterized protein
MPRVLRLLVVATAAGLWCGLFGVGGGTVMVPLLVLWLGWDARAATATSLGAIAVIAAVGVAAHLPYGTVRWGEAALVGGPALAGVVAGTALQQRLPERTIRLVFAAVLLATAGALVL